MTEQQLNEAVLQFFNDKSRSREETLEALQTLYGTLEGLIESLMEEAP